VHILAGFLSLFQIWFTGLIYIAYEVYRINQALRKQRLNPSIKPLLYTARVKRQTLVYFTLVLIALYGILRLGLIYSLGLVFYLSIFALALSIPFMILLVGLIAMPFEKLIKRFYQNKAINILSHSPKLKIIGITGSYGKTSSKNILNEILSEKYYTLATPASYNTPMGITITIREQLKAIHEVLICEMGADKKGEIKALMNFVKPQTGIVTSIGPQHLNTFKSINNIVKEKMRMIEMLPSNGLGIINKDNIYIREYQVKNPVTLKSVGIDSSDVDYQAINIHYTISGSGFTVRCAEGEYPFKTRLLGKHNISNILVSIALGRAFGLQWPQLQKAVTNVNYIEHRLQLKHINGLNFIDDAFNSNPDGSKMALDVLAMMPNHRYIVTPGMIDLGQQEDQLNQAFGAYMLNRADTVILIGKHQTKAVLLGLKESGFDLNHVLVMDHIKEAFDYLTKNASDKDTILLENDLPDAFNR
ncbi:MAG: UDP-N-acetylmuramoyl-tripeptide--D-alanyl-D-alanine ligase, partial [Erysipelotrichaceae bacterium]